MKKVYLLITMVLMVSTLYAQRDPLTWPFSKTSIWNMPIHNSAVYVPAGIQDAVNFEVDEDIIIMTPNEPLMNVETNNTGWNAGGDARCAAQGPTLFSAPIPQSFIFSNAIWHGSTPNSGAAILLPNGKIKQTQPFAKCSTTVATSLYSWDENNCELAGECITGAHGGAGLSAVGGTIRVGEFTSGEIKHVIKLNLWGKENFYRENGGFRWPAVKADGDYDVEGKSNYYNGSNPEMRIGALLAVHKDAILTSVGNNSLGLETEAALILARALQKYGGYTVDNTAWDTYGLITEIGPNGRVSDEFHSLYGFDMNYYGNPNTPWMRDIKKLFAGLHVVANNSATTIGGGPTADFVNRLAPMAPDFASAQTFKIMPLGDSKTAGAGPTDIVNVSYRGYLLNLLRNQGYSVDFVGDQTDGTFTYGAQPPYDREHSGHGGYTIGPDTNKWCETCETTGVYEHIESWLTTANPDIILLNIGVNDQFGGNDGIHPPNYQQTAPQRYQDLVDKILTLRPNVTLVLTTVEPVKWNYAWGTDPNDGQLGSLNDRIKQIANASTTDKIYLHDLNAAMRVNLNDADFGDDLHLSPQGAQKSANSWLNTLVPILNNTPLNIAPVVHITAPTGNITRTAPASVTIEVSATDSDGTVSKVEFYNGSQKIGENNQAPFSFTWNNVGEGTFVLTARAIDNVLGFGQSDNQIILTVNSTDGYVKFAGTNIGAPGSYENNGLTFERAFDTNADTFFDGPSPNGQWVGIDLGIAKKVSKVRFIPRTGRAVRMIGGKIQGANTANFSDAVDLYTIATTPEEYIYTVARFTNAALYQYYRYLSPVNGYGNVAEMEFWGNPSDPTDIPPTVTLTSPQKSALFASESSIRLSATASDADGSISKVEFYSGGTLLQTVTTAPYTFVWSNVVVGDYVITSRAYDNLNVAKESSAATISVVSTGSQTLYSENFNANTSNGWVASSGSWLAKNQSFQNSTVAEVTAYYSSISFSNYTFTTDALASYNNDMGIIFNYQNANNYLLLVMNTNTRTASIKSKVNGSYSVVTSGTFTGSGTGTNHVVSITNQGPLTSITINGAAVFTNVSTPDFTSGKIGYYSFYSPVTFDNITVTSTNANPVVSITSPTQGASFSAPATISIGVTASDPDGTISQVTFYNGDVLLGTDNASPYTWSWSNVAAGTYYITANAADNNGSSVTSSVVTVTVSASNVDIFDLSGTLTAQGEHLPSEGKAKAIDNSVTTKWLDFANANPTTRSSWLQYKLTGTTGFVVNQYKLTSANDAPARDPKNWTVLGSNDGTTWTILDTRTNETFASRKLTKTYTLENSVGFTYYKFQVNAVANPTSANSVQLAELELRGHLASSNTLPTVGISSPGSGSSFTAPATITLNATATDADGTIQKVDFYNGTTLLGTDTSAPYTYLWSPVNSGTYTVTATATDNAGGVKTSSAVNVSVNAAPTVTITSPATGSSFTAPASITINATAADPDGTIQKVDFYNGSTLIGTDTSSPYAYTWTGVEPGSYTLTAKASDNSGAETTSSSIAVTVAGPFVESWGFSNSPSTIAAGSTITVTMNYNTQVTRIITVYLYTASAQVIANGTVNVPVGSGTVGVQLNIPSSTPAQSNAYYSATFWTNSWGYLDGKGISPVTIAACASCTSLARTNTSEESGASVVVYPTPVRASFTIQMKGFRNPEVTILDLMNRVVFQKTVDATELLVTQPLIKGFYLVRVRDNSHRKVEKIIVE